MFPRRLSDNAPKSQSRSTARITIGDLEAHGNEPIYILRRPPGRNTAVIAQNAAVVPRTHESGDEDCHGRGLWLVESVSARWGTQPRPLGWNTVRAEVLTTEDVPDARLRASVSGGEASLAAG
jgi:hypothetical protein